MALTGNVMVALALLLQKQKRGFPSLESKESKRKSEQAREGTGVNRSESLLV